MKTILELASEIQKNQEGYKALLDCFRTTDDTLRLFLFSLKEVPAPMVPELLRTFYKEQERSTYKTFLDIIRNESFGTMFEHKESGITYQWAGFNKDNEPTVVKFGTNEQSTLDPASVVWRFF